MVEEARNEAYTKTEVGETDFSKSASFFWISPSYYFLLFF